MAPKNREAFDAEYRPPAYLADFIYVSLATGLRLSNVIATGDKPGFTWGHLNLERGTVAIPAREMKSGRDYLAPLHAELWDWLRRRRKKLGRPPKPSEPVIATGREIRKAFDSALRRAKLADENGNFTGELRDPHRPGPFRLHDLRHTAVSWFGEHCSEIATKLLAGHSTAEITYRYAKHQRIDFLREQINRVPALLGGKALARRRHAQ